MNKTQRIKEFVRITLEEETIEDLRGVSVKEAGLNFGLGLLMGLPVVLHLALTVWQLAVSFLLLGYDLITKGLAKILPSPKISR